MLKHLHYTVASKGWIINLQRADGHALMTSDYVFNACKSSGTPSHTLHWPSVRSVLVCYPRKTLRLHEVSLSNGLFDYAG